jgi:hypothetical protein
MPKAVEVVFFDMVILEKNFAGALYWYITWLRLVKNLTPGRRRVWAGTTLFAELQGRVGPET